MDGRLDDVPLARQWRAGQWLADGSLDEVTEINRQCLEFLGTMALAREPRLPALAAVLCEWHALPDAARARLAASPYLLADAGFDDESRWCALGPRMVHDQPVAASEPVFAGAGAEHFIRRVLMFGWHMARANRQLARVALGMSPACADRIGALRLQDLDWLAQYRADWVRPRWERQPRMWRHLLLAARDPDGEQLTQVSLRGLQLMAAGVLRGGAGGMSGAPRPRRG